MARGRKPQPCPDPHELRVSYAFDPRLAVVARQMGSNTKTVRRWLREIGITVPAPKKIRQRGSSRFVKVALLANGKRYWVKLYGVWNAMRGRCNSPGTKDYKRYGARGIRVCPEWDDYGAFRAWALSSGFRKGLTLDREDTNGNYEPNNCRWIPKGLQQDNTRRVHRLTLNGVTRSIPEWVRLLGVDARTVNSRKRIGWSDHDALTVPVGGDRGVPRKPKRKFGRMNCPACMRVVARREDGNARRHACANLV